MQAGKKFGYLAVVKCVGFSDNGAVCEGSQAIENNAPFGNADVFAREVFLRIKEFCVIA